MSFPGWTSAPNRFFSLLPFLMIYVNPLLCRLFHKIKRLDEYSLYLALFRHLPSLAHSCPSCHAPARQLSLNGSYSRHFVSYKDGKVLDHQITVRCLFCSSCGSSHALLPSLLIPSSSYSPGFLISLLYARITRAFPTVEALCRHFELSVSTYHRLVLRLAQDSQEMQHLLDCSLQSLDLLAALFHASPSLFFRSLYQFFLSSGYAFLQPRNRFRPKLHKASLPPHLYQIT